MIQQQISCLLKQSYVLFLAKGYNIFVFQYPPLPLLLQTGSEHGPRNHWCWHRTPRALVGLLSQLRKKRLYHVFTDFCDVMAVVLTQRIAPSTSLCSDLGQISKPATQGSDTLPYLIFVHSINSGASVKEFDWGEFFHNQREKDFWQLCTVVHSVLFHTQCVILHTVCNFTHSV